MISHDFIYLFVTDLVRQYHKHDYKSYEAKEPGYGVAWLKAYIYAFNSPKNEPLNATLIKEIHKIAMSFDASSNQGEYKNQSNSFPISPYLMYKNNELSARILSYSGSAKGIEEFIRYWFAPGVEHPLSLSISLKTDPSSSYILNNSQSIILLKGEKISSCAINFNKDIKQFTTLFANHAYVTSIDSLANFKDEECPSKTAELMDGIIHSYNTKIRQAQSDKEKIEAIVTHAQRIDQLHPFLDGNVRTCYILINKLLRDNNLSLSLVMNPNRLDCCSIDELIDMVVQGQIHFQQVMQHGDGPLILESPQEMDILLKSFTCPREKMQGVDESLIKQFIQTVLQPKAEARANSSAFFTHKNQPAANTLIAELKQLDCTVDDRILAKLNEGAFNAALRNACRFATDACIINKLLQYRSELTIDVTETSSNGKAPKDWLILNNNLSATDIKQIEESLCLLTEKLNVD